jgi:four helix bundle protein
VGAEQLKRRTQAFGLGVAKMVQKLPYDGPVRIIGSQLVRCGTSVGANFRAACRAGSRPDFIAKLKIVEEECDESIYWLEMLQGLGLGQLEVKPMLEEANQLLAIIVASIKTTRQKA